MRSNNNQQPFSPNQMHTMMQQMGFQTAGNQAIRGIPRRGRQERETFWEAHSSLIEEVNQLREVTGTAGRTRTALKTAKYRRSHRKPKIPKTNFLFAMTDHQLMTFSAR